MVSASNAFVRSLDKSVERLNGALRTVRLGAWMPQVRNYAKNVAGDALSREQITPCRQILALLVDAKERGASKADLMAFPNELTAIIDELYGVEAPEINAAFVGEERAEARKDTAEAILITEKSAPAAHEFLNARRDYIEADERLTRCARQILHGAHA